jgi:hypothetical protein
MGRSLRPVVFLSSNNLLLSLFHNHRAASRNPRVHQAATRRVLCHQGHVRGGYKLMFRRRSAHYDRFSSQSPAITGGDQFDYVPAAYLGLIKKWHSHPHGRTEDGFRRNSSKAPFDVVMVGDSFFEIGESEGATLAELLKDRTRLNVMNLGFAWYGPSSGTPRP